MTSTDAASSGTLFNFGIGDVVLGYSSDSCHHGCCCNDCSAPHGCCCHHHHCTPTALANVIWTTYFQVWTRLLTHVLITYIFTLYYSTNYHCFCCCFVTNVPSTFACCCCCCCQPYLPDTDTLIFYITALLHLPLYYANSTGMYVVLWEF